MQTRSVRASQSGQQKLKEAKAKDFKRSDDGERLSSERLAEKAHVSVSTVKRFFNGEPVDRPLADDITKALGLQLTDVLDVDLDTFYVDVPPLNLIVTKRFCNQERSFALNSKSKSFSKVGSPRAEVPTNKY